MKDFAKWVMYGGVFIVPFIPLIIANSFFFPYVTGKNFAFRIIVEVVLAAWVLLALYEPRYRPRFSWILTGFVSLVGVMFVADLFGEYPLKSFWSNFERMEGFVTLVHLLAYFVVLGSVMITDKLWDRFFNTTIAAAVILSLYAFQQLSGNIVINQGGWRLDGTLGNSAYMAVYMLFHICIAAYMVVRTPSRRLQYLYGGLTALFVFLLIQTATRGAILGLVGGTFVTLLYTFFAHKEVRHRKVGTGVLILLTLLVGLFVAFRDSAPIQNNPYLARVASISLSEGDIRFAIWGMAYEGFKERPILGWGQENFNYVFNERYSPTLYRAEAWYDRVHNIIFDWLIAGGILGFLAYFSLLAAVLYYLVVLPFRGKEVPFSVAERGLLLGVLAAYFFHNLFVFDNIVSYLFYASILAFIHARVTRDSVPRRGRIYNPDTVAHVFAPIVGVLLIIVVYYTNVPNLRAANDLIDALSASSVEQSLSAFEIALARGSFADQEIREQLMLKVQSILQSPEVSPEVKQRAFTFAESELLKEIEAKPGDARLHVFLGLLYRMSGKFDEATIQLNSAHELSPEKQHILFEQGLVFLQSGEYGKAVSYFKEAFEVDESYEYARTLYVTARILNQEPEYYDTLIVTERSSKEFLLNDLALQAAYTTENYPLLVKMFEARIVDDPTDIQSRVSLAATLEKLGDVTGSIAILEKAVVDFPEYTADLTSMIEDLR
ncbi:O-antigen ligase family protein [Candidatus Kaiserbacteria bacterium]|nr:O-antigen ligase family protein [Candidatus Kaiserbacteria bacterium]